MKTVHKLVDEFDELPSDDRRAMIEQVVSKVVVRQNQEIEFHLKVNLGSQTLKIKWSGWRDLNPRPLAPHASALARLRYIPIGCNRTRTTQMKSNITVFS